MTTPRVYVGTYAKYNNGSIDGAWIDLDDHDLDSFQEAIHELHKDEEDPEFMYQDWEGIPDEFIGECGFNLKEFFEYLEVVTTSYLDDEVFEAGMDLGIPYESIEDAYYGQFNSFEDLAYEYVESTGLLHDVPESIKMYFDYQSFGRDLAMDFSESDGHYFMDNY